MSEAMALEREVGTKEAGKTLELQRPLNPKGKLFLICHLETTGASPESQSPFTPAGGWPGATGTRRCGLDSASLRSLPNLQPGASPGADPGAGHGSPFPLANRWMLVTVLWPGHLQTLAPGLFFHITSSWMLCRRGGTGSY